MRSLHRYYNADEALRYLPIAKELNNQKSNDSTILEIGSGASGITSYIPFNIVGADINFSGPIAERLQPVYLSGANLPFADKSFEYVICVDMLEHVTKDARLSFVQEMFRVARKRLFIAVPCGPLSEDQDRRLDALYREQRGESYPFLIEHVEKGLPHKADIESYIARAASDRKSAIRVRVIKNVNLKIRHFFMSVWIKPRWTRFYATLSLMLSLFNTILNFGKCYRQIFIIDIE